VEGSQNSRSTNIGVTCDLKYVIHVESIGASNKLGF
jgi:hypothetical protein